VADCGVKWHLQFIAEGFNTLVALHPEYAVEAHAEDEMNAFKLLITPEMLDEIARETNREAERKVAAWNEANPHNIQEWNATSITEIQAVISLVILAGIHRGRLEPLEALWSARSGRPIFTAVTSLKRFNFKSLLRYLSFDNKATRETRRATDKLAAVILQWLQRSIKLRRQFLTSLGQQLVDDHIQQRLLNRRSIRKDTRLALKLLGYIDSPADMEAVEQPPAKRCCVAVSQVA